MKPDPENESPRRSWMIIFLGIVLIFGITFIFQQLNDPPVESIDPYSFDQLKDQVQTLRQELSELKDENDILKDRITELESNID